MCASILFLRSWIISAIISLNTFFWVACLSPLYLVVLLGFYLVPLSGTYSLGISFCVIFFDCSFHSAGCKVVVFLASVLCPLVNEADLRSLHRLPGGKDLFLPTHVSRWVLYLWWVGLCQRVCLVGNCGLRKTSGFLAAAGWGCVPSLLVVWPEASQHWSLQAVGWG